MSRGRRLFSRNPFCSEALSGSSDGDLLVRWVAHRDDAAFELLVRRHTPLVFSTCGRLLSNTHDAEDAFQAVFLILARKAASIARREVLAAWLHRVAFRVALRIRADRAKRTERQESSGADRLATTPPVDSALAELLHALDEEVERLPTRQRVVFVLCCLEGRTGEEVGQLLGCPPGTVSSRLTRARQHLRTRLTRRGFTLAGMLVATVTSDALAIPALSVQIEPIIRATSLFGIRSTNAPPDRPTTIAEGVIRAMFLQKLKVVSVFAVASALAVSAVFAASGTRLRDDPEPARPNLKRVANARESPTANDERNSQDKPPAKEAEGKLKKQLLDESRSVYEQDLKRYKAGVSSTVEDLYLWSNRWLEAELDLAANANARATAFKAHLDRMKEVEKAADSHAKIGQGRASDAAAGRYYRAQADLWLLRGRR